MKRLHEACVGKRVHGVVDLSALMVRLCISGKEVEVELEMRRDTKQSRKGEGET